MDVGSQAVKIDSGSPFSKNIQPGRSISIKEARKILGRQSKELSDDQMIEILNTLSLMARRFLSNASSKKEQGV